MAQGGIALLGESGPELAHMPTGTRVHTAHDTKQMLRDAGSTEVKVIVNGSIISDHPDPVEVVLGDRRYQADVEERVGAHQRQRWLEERKA